MHASELIVSSRDGLFLLERSGGGWDRSGNLLPGHDVSHARRDPVSGDLWAAAKRGDEPGFLRSPDGGATWSRAGIPAGAERAWHVMPGPDGTVWAGTEPAALHRTRDGGATWEPLPTLNDHPSREEWYPGGGGMMLHTILLQPERPGRVTVAISVAGCFRSEDGGETWAPANEGSLTGAEMWLQFTGNEARHLDVHRCVHKIVPHPTRPDTFFQQQHVGVYRSDDGGATWTAIGEGLPSSFGFGIAAAPHDGPAGCAVWVIPQSEETLRTVDGIGIWRTLDGGESWQEQRAGLPAEGDYMILRDAMTATDGIVCAGSTDGTLWGSHDLGESWSALATGLGRIQAVEVG